MAGGDHAVEDVHAAGDGADQVLRRAHAHQVARALPGHRGFQRFQHGQAFVLRFTHGQSAHRIPVETDFRQPGH